MDKKLEYLGSPSKPEDENNHKLGKWCYVMDKHCECATKGPKDCLKCISEGWKEGVNVG